MAKKTKSKGAGYVPFTREDINLEDGRNTLAEELFLQMLEIPKKVIKKKNKGKDDTIVDDDFYPTTRDELERMEGMMVQVEAAIDDRSDREFMDNVAYMKDIFTWSKRRHWNFAWWIVVCVAVVAIYFFVQAGNRAKDRDVIKNWTEETLKTNFDASVKSRQDQIAYHEQRVAEAADAAAKKDAAESLASAQKNLEEHLEQGAEGYKEMLLKHGNRKVRGSYISAFWCLIWIALYIVAERPYGYMVSRRRTEAKIYSGLRKALFGLAGGMVAVAGAMKVTETVTRYSDGSKSTSSDAGGVLAIQIMLLVGAAALVLVAARIVIVIATIMGFLRNYDLISMGKQAFNKGKELTSKKELAS